MVRIQLVLPFRLVAAVAEGLFPAGRAQPLGPDEDFAAVQVRGAVRVAAEPIGRPGKPDGGTAPNIDT
jgi:hypothetical protein